jgi:5-methylcytosine-specific restriction enzyme subunit McrC
MIPIHNIYYMLSYAFQVLREQGYKDLATEQFDNSVDLCAAILAKGVAVQLKRGLHRAYVAETEPLSTLRGKIDITESIKTQTILKRQLVCTYDEFSVNSYMNRVIKSTIELLLFSDIAKARKKELRKILVYFTGVESIAVHTINWQFRYNRNNQTYRMLISICYLVIKGLLQCDADGSTRLMNVFDEQRMSRLYEKFILEYYRREIPQLTANASQIAWQLDDERDHMLPIMQSDIMLSYEDKILVIDAKYYARTTQTQYDAHTLHSNNLYQIFTYVKNKAAECSNDSQKVSGMLLYARTADEIQPNQTYQMSGNKIGVRTLNLDCAFSEIACQLNGIAEEHFGIVFTE